MTEYTYDCPVGYTCTLEIYPAWHDVFYAGLIFGLIVVAIIVIVWLANR